MIELVPHPGTQTCSACQDEPRGLFTPPAQRAVTEYRVNGKTLAAWCALHAFVLAPRLDRKSITPVERNRTMTVINPPLQRELRGYELFVEVVAYADVEPGAYDQSNWADVVDPVSNTTVSEAYGVDPGVYEEVRRSEGFIDFLDLDAISTLLGHPCGSAACIAGNAGTLAGGDVKLVWPVSYFTADHEVHWGTPSIQMDDGTVQGVASGALALFGLETDNVRIRNRDCACEQGFDEEYFGREFDDERDHDCCREFGLFDSSNDRDDILDAGAELFGKTRGELERDVEARAETLRAEIAAAKAAREAAKEAARQAQLAQTPELAW